MISGAYLLSFLPLLVALTDAQAVVKTAVLGNVYDGDYQSGLESALPAAPTYSKVKWSLSQGMMFKDGTWKSALTDTTYDRYCGANMNIYNVTFSDCSGVSFVMGHCTLGTNTESTVFNQFGRIPPNLRAAISDFHYNKGSNSEGNSKQSVDMGGSAGAGDFVQLAVRAMYGAVDFVKTDAWKNAVNADTCVVDNSASGDLNRTSPDYQTAGIRAGVMVAFNKITGKWPQGSNPTTCMANQIKVISDTFADRFDKTGKCANHVQPVIQKTWTTLLTDFSDFDASTDRKPPATSYTYTKWATGSYPQFCYDQSTTARASDDNQPVCALSNIEVYNVTFGDCTQYPWTVCRCTDAQITVDGMFTAIARIPPGVRSHVVHVFVLDGTRADGSVQKYGGSSNDRYVIKGPIDDAAFVHEAMHSVDQGFHETSAYTNAYNADWCVPDKYASSSPAENFAQLGVWVDYDTNGKAISSYLPNVDSSCMANQLAAVKTYASTYIDLKVSKCYARRPNDNIVTPVTSAKFKVTLKPPATFDFEDDFSANITTTTTDSEGN